MKNEQNNNHVNESILSEQILEDQKKNRINHMEYLPGNGKHRFRDNE